MLRVPAFSLRSALLRKATSRKVAGVNLAGLVLGGAAICGVVLAPERADACGPSPVSSYRIGAVSPASGALGVARDSGIVVSGLPLTGVRGVVGEFARVELIDVDNGAAVPLTDFLWRPFGAAEDTMAFHPLEPLAPRHSYRVEATPIDLDEGAAVFPTFASSFVTSDALLEPLVLTGEIELSLAGEEVDAEECGDCYCNPVGKKRALVASVQLPVPSGGQGVYQGMLHFTNDTPRVVSTRDLSIVDNDGMHIFENQPVKAEPGQGSTVRQEIVELDTDYAGCFTFVVWDPAGHVAQTSACLPSMSPDQIRALAASDAEMELASDDATAAEQVAQAAPPDSAAGCTVGVGRASARPLRQGTGRALLPSALLLSALLMRRGRRR